MLRKDVTWHEMQTLLRRATTFVVMSEINKHEASIKITNSASRNCEIATVQLLSLIRL